MRRSVLLVVALVIALLGTGLIVLYVKGIDSRAVAGQELVEVLVATDAIDTGESVSAAMEAGKFEKGQVRRADLVEGAIASTTEIQDLVALATIYPGEQIIARRFGSLGQTEGLVIPDRKVAVSVELTDPERVAGFVNPGSEVAVFVSADLSALFADGSSQNLGPKTQLLLPRALVIGVGTTSVTPRTTTVDGEQITEDLPRTILTLALDQEDAEKLIFADRNGDLNFALLTTDSRVKPGRGVRGNDVMSGN
jgi:pilus assembly protein CpaB